MKNPNKQWGKVPGVAWKKTFSGIAQQFGGQMPKAENSLVI